MTSSDEVLFVPEGWTTPAPGYWMTERAGRDVFAGWSADRAERDYLSALLEAQFDRTESFLDSMGWSLRGAESDLDAILKEKDARIAALEKKKRRPGFIVGVGVTNNGEIRGMAGVGWKF